MPQIVWTLPFFPFIQTILQVVVFRQRCFQIGWRAEDWPFCFMVTDDHSKSYCQLNILKSKMRFLHFVGSSPNISFGCLWAPCNVGIQWSMEIRIREAYVVMKVIVLAADHQLTLCRPRWTKEWQGSTPAWSASWSSKQCQLVKFDSVNSSGSIFLSHWVRLWK